MQTKPDVLTCHLTAEMTLTLRECLCGLALKYRRQKWGFVLYLGGSDLRCWEQPRHAEKRPVLLLEDVVTGPHRGLTHEVHRCLFSAAAFAVYRI